MSKLLLSYNVFLEQLDFYWIFCFQLLLEESSFEKHIKSITSCKEIGIPLSVSAGLGVPAAGARLPDAEGVIYTRVTSPSTG